MSINGGKVMKKVIIVYFSLAGHTENMAQYISEGVRFSGQEAVMKKVSEIKSIDDLNGYDAYIFGSPTYFQDVAEPMKTFLFLARKADLQGKLAGAFGPYTHDVSYKPGGNASAIIFDTMQYVYKMAPFELGAFKLMESIVDTIDGMRACQDYGKVFGNKVSS
jgi:flavodoxin